MTHKIFAYLCIGLSAQTLLYAHHQNNHTVQGQELQWQDLTPEQKTAALGSFAYKVMVAGYNSPFDHHDIYNTPLGSITVGIYFKNCYKLLDTLGTDNLCRNYADTINKTPIRTSLFKHFWYSTVSTVGIGAATYLYTKNRAHAADATIFSAALWVIYCGISLATYTPDQDQLNVRKQDATQAIASYLYNGLDALTDKPTDSMDTIKTQLDSEQEICLTQTNPNNTVTRIDIADRIARYNLGFSRFEELGCAAAGAVFGGLAFQLIRKK